MLIDEDFEEFILSYGLCLWMYPGTFCIVVLLICLNWAMLIDTLAS